VASSGQRAIGKQPEDILRVMEPIKLTKEDNMLTVGLIPEQSSGRNIATILIGRPDTCVWSHSPHI